jgi:hypothetical protein
MPKMPTNLRAACKDNPRETFDLIVRVDGDVKLRGETMRGIGVKVRRQFSLTNSMSVRCTGEEALALSRRSWVKSIEPDGPVKALGR